MCVLCVGSVRFVGCSCVCVSAQNYIVYVCVVSKKYVMRIIYYIYIYIRLMRISNIFIGSLSSI